MEASLMTWTGLPNGFRKSNPAQPWPRCFGFRTIRPWRIGEGNPIEMASKLQLRTVSLKFATKSRGVIPGPEENFRWSSNDIRSFTCEPPLWTTRTLFFMAVAPLRYSLSPDDRVNRWKIPLLAGFTAVAGGQHSTM